MTKVNRPRAFESDSLVRSRGRMHPIVVGLRPGALVLTFRLKGHRQEYFLNTKWCFLQALEAQLQADKEAKRAARKARRGLA